MSGWVLVDQGGWERWACAWCIFTWASVQQVWFSAFTWGFLQSSHYASIVPDTIIALEDSPVFKTSIKAELTVRRLDLVRGPGLENKRSILRTSTSSPPLSVSLSVFGVNRLGREGRERGG